jgi:hypothetical protein
VEKDVPAAQVIWLSSKRDAVALNLSVRPETLFGFSCVYGEPDGRRSSEDDAGRIFEELQRTRRPPDGLEKAKKVFGRTLRACQEINEHMA